jgi:large subunit ribosomal protein L30
VSSLKVKQTRSTNGSDKSQIATMRSLGLRRIGQEVSIPDSPQAKGMIAKVRHLVEVSEDG